MLAVDSSIMAATHYVSSTVVGAAASEHSASEFGIAAKETDTGGAAFAMAPAVGSSMGVERTS
jgi:hypothetical protein